MCVLGQAFWAQAVALRFLSMKSYLRCFGVGCDKQSHGFLRAVVPRGKEKGVGSTGAQLSPLLSLLVECWNATAVCRLPLGQPMSTQQILAFR